MLFLLVSQALAQVPAPITLSIPSAADRWLVAETPSKRFPGEQVAGPTFTSGEKVEVILEENGLARVFSGDKYGWVPVASLTTKAPAAAAPLAMPAGGGLLGAVPAPPPTK